MLDAERVRAELRKIGERRAEVKAEDARLAEDTARAIKRARRARLPMTEVAALVGLDRTYLYRGYGA